MSIEQQWGRFGSEAVAGKTKPPYSGSRPVAPSMPKRSLPKRIASRLRRAARTAVGLHSFLSDDDRRVLEQIIFPYFQHDPACRDVLFVGCDWYTEGYTAWFGAKNYWTLDIDPAQRKFGAEQHIVDGLQNISRHFRTGTLDLIICNGVFGWGLNAPGDVEQAVSGCIDALRTGGHLVIGVDDVDDHRPIALETCGSLLDLAPYCFPPLNTANFLTDTSYGHRFMFFRKMGRFQPACG